jgi:hypothetical protein
MQQLPKQHARHVLLVALCGRLLLLVMRCWRFRAALRSRAAASITMNLTTLLLRWLHWSMIWLR